MKQSRIVSIAVMFLFGIFAVCIGLVLITGARVYQGVTGRDSQAISAQAAKQYLIMKTHSMDDVSSSMQVTDLHGESQEYGPALTFLEDINGSVYKTVIYCDGTHICELFTGVDMEFDPAMGEIVMDADSLNFEATDSGVIADIQIDGSRYQVYLAVQTNRGEPA